jgi:DNA-binding CsgD family transcriptional regulator
MTAPALTRREREIAGLVARGMTNREIAEALVISVRTVDNHLSNAYAKLGVATRAELVETLGR